LLTKFPKLSNRTYPRNIYAYPQNSHTSLSLCLTGRFLRATPLQAPKANYSELLRKYFYTSDTIPVGQLRESADVPWKTT